MSEPQIRAEVHLDRGSFVGDVVDGSAGTLLVAFPTIGAPEIRVGAPLPHPLKLQGLELGEPLEVTANVTFRRDTPERRTYGFTLDEPGRLSRVLAGEQLPQFDRRTWVRARPPSTHQVPVDVVGTAGPGTGMTLRGRLLDLSGGGLGAVLDRDAERFLARSTDVVVRLVRPGQEEVETFGCRVANRALTEENEIRYGLEFVHVEGLAPRPKGDYQQAWDCDACGATSLLGKSHLHCPQCGHARGSGQTYFPEWDDLVLDSEHAFSGDDRRCAFCTSTFSSEARFCGSCGKPLV